ncbi:MAG: hypothetical protein PWQ75_698 [Methanolobus sp.]|uniref:glycosyltransferase family 4 protein n=1 Tax=Methanolobus sp. TaxID=1874737 RepID=UPI00258B4831|nr:glycosyltransferase family 4 protein [Methanolobus sp.]MDK2830946.1 hypothetical protein [Methanolobus sp.]
MSSGAPALVGRTIFEYLLKRRNDLPFDNIFVFTSHNHKEYLEYLYDDVVVLTASNILNTPRGIVHIPMSPLLFPNTKFILHILSILLRNVLVFNYHGDIRTEVILNFKKEYKISFSYLPTYLFLPILLRSSNQLIVHSYLFKNLVENKYGVKNTTVIPNAVDSFWYSDEYDDVFVKSQGIDIFYHGRLSPEKGVDILIEGFHKYLTGNSRDATLYIAGDGPQREFLLEMVKSLKVTSNVVFLGNLDKSKVKGYLKKVDVAIYPSIWDNFPLSYIEAFASANCPVFFSKKAGIYDFVVAENKNMFSFDPSIESICQIIEDASSNLYVDSNVIDEQKSFANKYNWDYVIDYYIKVYSKLVMGLKR